MDILKTILESQRRFNEDNMFVFNNNDGLNDEEISVPNRDIIIINELDKYIKNNNNKDVVRKETKKYITYTISSSSVFNNLMPFITQILIKNLTLAVKNELKNKNVKIPDIKLTLNSLSECRFKITQSDIISSQGRINYTPATDGSNYYYAIVKIKSINGVLKFEKQETPILKTAKLNFNISL